MPILRLLPGRPRRVFFSVTAFLGGILFFGFARAGEEEEKGRRGEEGRVSRARHRSVRTRANAIANFRLRAFLFKGWGGGDVSVVSGSLRGLRVSPQCSALLSTTRSSPLTLHHHHAPPPRPRRRSCARYIRPDPHDHQCVSTSNLQSLPRLTPHSLGLTVVEVVTLNPLGIVTTQILCVTLLCSETSWSNPFLVPR